MSKISDNESVKSAKDLTKVFVPIAKGVIFLNKFGVISKSLADACKTVVEIEKEFGSLDIPDRFNAHFAQRGWVAYESMNHELMKKTVELADTGKQEKAEELLVENFSPEMMDFVFIRMKTNPIARLRYDLARLYSEDYFAGRYHSCVPGVLMIIDGIVSDLNNQAFFSSSSSTVSWDSIAGHESGLNRLQEVMHSSRKKTNVDLIKIPYRNGILHGRDLGFANKIVATKCWAALAAILDWADAKNTESTRKAEWEKNSKITIWDSLKSLEKNRNTRKEMKKWKKRRLSPGSDIPLFGSPEDFTQNSPEQKAAELLLFLTQKNFGKIAQNTHYTTALSLGKRAGQIRGMLNDLKIEKWQFVHIDDQAPAICEITVAFYLDGHSSPVQKKLRFLYVGLDGESVAIAGVTDGKWQLIEISLNSLQSLIYVGL